MQDNVEEGADNDQIEGITANTALAAVRWPHWNCRQEPNELADIIVTFVLPFEQLAMQGCKLITDSYERIRYVAGSAAVSNSYAAKQLKDVRGKFKQSLCDAFENLRQVHNDWALYAMHHACTAIRVALEAEGMLVVDNMPQVFTINSLVELFFDPMVMAYFSCRPQCGISTIDLPESADLSGAAVDESTKKLLQSCRPRLQLFDRHKKLIGRLVLLAEGAVVATASVCPAKGSS